MEEFSNTSVWELLKIMQQKVRANATIIQKNVGSLDLIKKKYGQSKKRDKIVNSIYKQNFELTNENTVLLDLHNSLCKFYKSHSNLLKSKNGVDQIDPDTKERSWERYRKECMEKSISGEMKLNSYHPFMSDDNFMEELMVRCQSLELYERCLEIKQAKELF